MNSIKVAAAISCCLITAIVVFVLLFENPQHALYKKTINTMMIQEGLSSEEQVLEHWPELKEVGKMMEKIGQLNSDIHSLTAGPSPMLSGEEQQLVEQYRMEIRTLQRSVNDQLALLLTSHTEELANH